MRIWVLALGLIIIFAGLIVTSSSRNAVTKESKTEQNIPGGTGPINAPEISVTLNNSQKYKVVYNGGGRNVNPDDIIVNIYDPSGNLTTLDYTTEFQNGFITNSSGLYKIGLGAPGLIDPSNPLVLVVREIVVITTMDYPNSNLLPYGLAAIIIGAGISLLGVLSQRHKTTRRQRTRRTG